MRKRGHLEAQIEVVVPFHDVDLAQVVWHGHYLKYLENARWALMKRIGFDLDAMRSSGYRWPIIDVQLRCVRAARYDERLLVRASLIEWEHRLDINYLVIEAVSHERVARARTTQVAVDANGVIQLITPEVLRDRIASSLVNQEVRTG